jgi:hypothetical protein
VHASEPTSHDVLSVVGSPTPGSEDAAVDPGDDRRYGASGDDRPGSSGAESVGEALWRPPIVKTVAQTGDGVAELWNAIGEHRQYLEDRGLLAVNRAKRLANRVRQVLMSAMEHRVDDLVASGAFMDMMPLLVSAEMDPYEAADRLMSLDREVVAPREREGLR